MSETPNLALPLLASAQAQKHVTVNEALTRLDLLTWSTAVSQSVSTPPASPTDGDRYIVPAGATGDWSGQSTKIAAWVNGGWEFLSPIFGCRVGVVDDFSIAVFDGVEWRTDGLSLSTHGAATESRVIAFEHTIAAGATSDTTTTIPDRAIVLGVTARVATAITGATSWRLGVVGAEDRYGSGLSVALNSECHGVTSAPVGYYGDTALRLTADGGTFSGGVVRIAIHLLRLAPPSLL